MLRYAAQNRLNEVLMNIVALKICNVKTITKAMETVIATPFGERHTPWTVFLETQTALMVQHMQGWAWRPDQDMKEWCRGGQPDVLIENQDDGPNRDNEDFPGPPQEFCLRCYILAGQLVLCARNVLQ